MEEWITAHESLNSMQVNASKDTQNSVKQKPSSEHGDSTTNPSTSPSAASSSSSSVYYSARTENMIVNKNKFSSDLEFNIEYSKAHWSQLADTDDDEDTEYSAEADLEHFERLKARRGWGEFFKDFQSLVVGEKIAEGAQAEIYEATLSGQYECVVKVFKEGYALRDLQRQWPEGMLKSYKEMTLSPFDSFRSMGEVEKGAMKGPLECILGATLLKDERLKNRFAFVMKRQWGDLRKLIDAQMLNNNNHGPPFSRRRSWNLMLNIAWDMRNLHQIYGIIHRDLKASNVLLQSLPQDLKLSNDILEERKALLMKHHSLRGDLSASIVYSRRTLVYSIDIPTTVADFECSLGVVGTAFWRAPEIVQQLKNGIPTSKIRFSYEADVYSYGMTCYEIATRRIPFEDHSFTDYSIVLNGERPDLPHDLDPFVKKVITDCWHPDPSQRPYFCDIIDAFSENEETQIIERIPTGLSGLYMASDIEFYLTNDKPAFQI